MGTLTNLVAATPTYDLTLPSNGKKITYRPFLVKEEKILLIASESKNEKEIYKAMQDVVSACTFGKIDMAEAALVDIEYLFINIRTKSVGETSTPQIKCSSCQHPNQITINLSELNPNVSPNHTNKINLTEDTIIEMRCPTYSDIEKMQDKKTDTERMFTLIALCVDKIHTPTQTFTSKEVGLNDVAEFIESLTQIQFKKMSEFFETMPQLTKEVAFKCKCGHEDKITLKGVADFF